MEWKPDLEVYFPTLAIRDTPFIKNLKQYHRYVLVSFFQFIEQDDRCEKKERHSPKQPKKNPSIEETYHKVFVGRLR